MLFSEWYSDHLRTGTPTPESMTLATTGPNGAPSARIVLLRRHDRNGFVFFTNYLSRKGTEIGANPAAALLFHWPLLERQIRIEGIAAKISPEESDDYFASRDRDSQIGAWASHQSAPIGSRRDLEKEFARYAKEFTGIAVPRPPHWGGILIRPHTFEFWQGRPARLHDRILFTAARDGGWTVSRLAP